RNCGRAGLDRPGPALAGAAAGGGRTHCGKSALTLGWTRGPRHEGAEVKTKTQGPVRRAVEADAGRGRQAAARGLRAMKSGEDASHKSRPSRVRSMARAAQSLPGPLVSWMAEGTC